MTGLSVFDHIGFWMEDVVAVISMNAPLTRNAISEAMRDEILVALEIAASDYRARALVLTGSGRNFSSGADLREFGRLTSITAARRSRRTHNVYRQTLALPIPTVALLQGAVVGGGFELALACDVRIAVEGARFGLPEVRLGFIPGGGGTQTSWRRVGCRDARWLSLWGRMISAREALRLGIVQEVCDSYGDAWTRACGTAAKLATLDAPTYARVRAVVDYMT